MTYKNNIKVNKTKCRTFLCTNVLITYSYYNYVNYFSHSDSQRKGKQDSMFGFIFCPPTFDGVYMNVISSVAILGKQLSAIQRCLLYV